MNDVTQRAGVISSGMLVFFIKYFFGGFFWKFIMITYSVDLTSFLHNWVFRNKGLFGNKGLCLFKFVEVLETKKLEAKGYYLILELIFFTMEGAHDLDTKNKVIITSGFTTFGVLFKSPTSPSLSFSPKSLQILK